MKKSKYTEEQIAYALREAETGTKVSEVCRKIGVAEATFYNWKKKYSGMDATQLKKLKELEEENRRLKRMYADLSLDHELLKEVLEKKF